MKRADPADRDRDAARHAVLVQAVADVRASLQDAWMRGLHYTVLRDREVFIEQAQREMRLLERRWPLLRDRGQGAGPPVSASRERAGGPVAAPDEASPGSPDHSPSQPSPVGAADPPCVCGHPADFHWGKGRCRVHIELCTCLGYRPA